MAITPPSDIVLGVALAADPQKYRTAAERLQRLSAVVGAGADMPSWQASVTREPARDGAVADSNPARPIAPRAATGSSKQAAGASDAFGKLEAFVLQTFVQSMLPKNASHVFGKGTAGDVWKSMLAEKLANEIARSGQVGLAKRLQAGATASRLALAGPRAAATSSLASVVPYLQQQVPAIGPRSFKGVKS